MLQLKSYAVGTEETSRFYSLYFNDEVFVTLNRCTGNSASALVACQYAASIGWLVVMYTILFLSRYRKQLISIVCFFSQVSPPCVAVVVIIVVYDIHSYTTQYEYSTSEWLRAFPIPIVFVMFSTVNLPLAVAVVVDDAGTFRLPGLMQLLYNMWGSNKYSKVREVLFGCAKVVLIFSVTSIAILGVFHVAWVVLAFSSYPVRSIASQAFITPFVIVVFVVLMVMDYSARSQSTSNLSTGDTCRLFFVFAMCTPLVTTFLGVLYFYSQALVDVNDSENNPFKSVLAAVTPAIIAAVIVWMARVAISKIEKEAGMRSSSPDIEPYARKISLGELSSSPSTDGDSKRLILGEEKRAKDACTLRNK